MTNVESRCELARTVKQKIAFVVKVKLPDQQVPEADHRTFVGRQIAIDERLAVRSTRRVGQF